MSWDVTERRASGLIDKSVRLRFSHDPEVPTLELEMTIPDQGRAAPVFLTANGGPPNRLVLERGYGVVDCKVTQVFPDDPAKVSASIGAALGHDPAAWGAIGTWAWALRRAMDYLETDADIDASRVCLEGFSRFGKTAMWAGAQDERFAITFSGQSGCAGHVLVRRQFGETVKLINQLFPHWFNARFKSYGDRVDELPIDWHELIALHAPRPVYIAAAEQDLWGDPSGSFLAARNADPAYELFGMVGLQVNDLPLTDTPVGDLIGFHLSEGEHGLTNYDWTQFLGFAERHLATVSR